MTSIQEHAPSAAQRAQELVETGLPHHILELTHTVGEAITSFSAYVEESAQAVDEIADNRLNLIKKVVSFSQN